MMNIFKERKKIQPNTACTFRFSVVCIQIVDIKRYAICEVFGIYLPFSIRNDKTIILLKNQNSIS